VDIKNLSKIYPYSKLLNDISIKDGNISLAIKDNKNIKFNAKVKGLSLPNQKREHGTGHPIKMMKIGTLSSMLVNQNL
jgi:hypothetical protein